MNHNCDYAVMMPRTHSNDDICVIYIYIYIYICRLVSEKILKIVIAYTRDVCWWIPNDHVILYLEYTKPWLRTCNLSDCIYNVIFTNPRAVRLENDIHLTDETSYFLYHGDTLWFPTSGCKLCLKSSLCPAEFNHSSNSMQAILYLITAWLPRFIW